MALTTVNPGLLDNNAQYTGFKNRIINGDMRIDQRNAGASVLISNTGNTYVTDRWQQTAAVGSKLTIQKLTSTPPAGFSSYTRISTSTAYTPTGNESFTFRQIIEGVNMVDFAYGTASASSVTLSFWIRSSLTGMFGGSLVSGGYSNPFSYTISSANTWEYKTVTFTPQTYAAAPADYGMYVQFSMGATGTALGTPGTWVLANQYGATGQTNLIATLNATLDITGVQLEKGSTATSFDYRPYGTELALCQRYYYKKLGAPTTKFDSGYITNTTGTQGFTNFPVTMRTAPTALEQSGTAGDYSVNWSGGSTVCSSVPVFNAATQDGAQTGYAVASGLTAGQGCLGRAVTTNAYLGWSAEL